MDSYSIQYHFCKEVGLVGIGDGNQLDEKLQ